MVSKLIADAYYGSDLSESLKQFACRFGNKFGKEESKLALQLFKLASETFPAISATTSQAVNAYFHTASTGGINVATGATASLLAASWVDSDGGAVTAFATAQGLNQLFSNGVLQQPSLYSVVATAVRLTASAIAIAINSGTPLTLQTYNARAAVVVSAIASSRIAIP